MMQKSKSFKKPTKQYKQLSSNSSKVLLQLSSITLNSKDKSNLTCNFTDRTYHQIKQNENYSNQNMESHSTCKPYLKKQNQIKKNGSLSNKVLKEIMNFSNYLNTRKISDQSIKNGQNPHKQSLIKSNSKDKQIIVLSKQDLKKSKNLSQSRPNNKLLLYNTNQKPVMSKSKSSYNHQPKGQSIVCNIKIHPLQQNKSSYFPLNQKRQSFDNKRSSFNSSRRSSIYLFQQSPSSNMDFNQIKKSLLAKISNGEEDINIMSNHNSIKPNSFSKVNKKLPQTFGTEQDNGAHHNYQNQNSSVQSSEDITPRQKKLLKQQCISKLDQLTAIQNDIKKQAPQFIKIWQQLILCQKNLKNYNKYYPQIKQKYQFSNKLSQQLNRALFEENKKYIQSKKMIKQGYENLKEKILTEVQRIHSQVKKKVFKKDLEDMMVFNMKIVLPSASDLIESNMSITNHNNSHLIQNSTVSNQNQTISSYANFPILQLYEQLMRQKACKKYGMILKKQINNMNMYDSKTMSEYLKKLYQLQNNYHKTSFQSPQQQSNYFQKIQYLVDKIQQNSHELQSNKQNYENIQSNINSNSIKHQALQNSLHNLLKQVSQHVFNEYKIFQTGNCNIQQTNKYSVGNSYDGSRQSSQLSQKQKTIQQFYELVKNKYESIYQRFKEVKQNKRVVQHSIRVYQ